MNSTLAANISFYLSIKHDRAPATSSKLTWSKMRGGKKFLSILLSCFFVTYMELAFSEIVNHFIPSPATLPSFKKGLIKFIHRESA